MFTVSKYTINQCLQKEYCIIDDLRYHNELEACLKNNFVIIELTLPLEVQMERIKKVYPENYQEHIDTCSHLSEQNTFTFPEGYPHINFMVQGDNEAQLLHGVNLLVMKQ